MRVLAFVCFTFTVAMASREECAVLVQFEDYDGARVSHGTTRAKRAFAVAAIPILLLIMPFVIHIARHGSTVSHFVASAQTPFSSLAHPSPSRHRDNAYSTTMQVTVLNVLACRLLRAIPRHTMLRLHEGSRQSGPSSSHSPIKMPSPR